MTEIHHQVCLEGGGPLGGLSPQVEDARERTGVQEPGLGRRMGLTADPLGEVVGSQLQEKDGHRPGGLEKSPLKRPPCKFSRQSIWPETTGLSSSSE